MSDFAKVRVLIDRLKEPPQRMNTNFYKTCTDAAFWLDVFLNEVEFRKSNEEHPAERPETR